MKIKTFLYEESICCTITKKTRTLLYDNLLLEAIFIISMVMVVEGVGGLGYGILCTFMGDGIEKSQHHN